MHRAHARVSSGSEAYGTGIFVSESVSIYRGDTPQSLVACPCPVETVLGTFCPHRGLPPYFDAACRLLIVSVASGPREWFMINAEAAPQWASVNGGCSSGRGSWQDTSLRPTALWPPLTFVGSFPSF